MGFGKLTTFQTILISYLSVILLGTALLMLPAASQSGGTSLLTALFTAVSSVCVTGLVVADTATYWTGFGQTVILLLIQTGGLGAVTIAVMISVMAGRKISLVQRSVLKDAVSGLHVGGIIRFLRFILFMTVCTELAGAVLLAPVMIRDFGMAKGLWYALFHSVSAFCNAGFDLMGIRAPFSSLTHYHASPLINLTVSALIVTGGLGFLTWQDISENKWHFRDYRLQTKIILCASTVLIIVPAVLFFIFEYRFLPLPERILASLFQSVTARTAGFNTQNLSLMSEPGMLLMIVLMLVGGSPGSTAGGMKTTTLFVLIFWLKSSIGRHRSVNVFNRRIEQQAVNDALTILLMYLLMFLTGSALIAGVEKLPLLTCMYETASALGTVGLTLGITPSLSRISRIVLILCMYFGRSGGLTLAYAAVRLTERDKKYPEEKVMVG